MTNNPTATESHGQVASSLRTTVLLSGGMDSAALLHFLLASGHDSICALHIDYGQAARRHELVAARSIAEHFAVSLGVVETAGLATSGPGEVFARNALLVIVAAAYSKSAHGVIAIGIHGGTVYDDCKPAFIDAMQNILDVYSCGSLRVLAPFLTWSKRQVLDYAISNELPIHLTRSCEADEAVACGQCLSCRDLEDMNAGSGKTTFLSR